MIFRLTAHLNDCQLESILAGIAPLRSRCSVSLDVCSYNRACEIINWSILRPCSEYEQWEREGTAEIVEFGTGLQTRQEERYVIMLFLLLMGGKFCEFFLAFALVIHPLTVKNRPCALIWACAFNWKNTVTYNIIGISHLLWKSCPEFISHWIYLCSNSIAFM